MSTVYFNLSVGGFKWEQFLCLLKISWVMRTHSKHPKFKSPSYFRWIESIEHIHSGNNHKRRIFRCIQFTLIYSAMMCDCMIFNAWLHSFCHVGIDWTLSDFILNCYLPYEMRYKNTVAIYQRDQINNFIKVNAVTDKSHSQHHRSLPASMRWFFNWNGIISEVPSSNLHLVAFSAIWLHKRRNKMNEEKTATHTWRYVSATAWMECTHAAAICRWRFSYFVVHVFISFHFTGTIF